MLRRPIPIHGIYTAHAGIATITASYKAVASARWQRRSHRESHDSSAGTTPLPAGRINTVDIHDTAMRSAKIHPANGHVRRNR
jgi:hypothetical protein